MKKYLIPFVMLFFNNEVLSIIALVVVGIMFLLDLAREAERRKS